MGVGNLEMSPTTAITSSIPINPKKFKVRYILKHYGALPCIIWPIFVLDSNKTCWIQSQWHMKKNTGTPTHQQAITA
jgi:hypothetical protein